MTEAASGLVDAQGNPIKRTAADGSCPDCGAGSDVFKPVLGGDEVCMECGHQRRADG